MNDSQLQKLRRLQAVAIRAFAPIRYHEQRRRTLKTIDVCTDAMSSLNVACDKAAAGAERLSVYFDRMTTREE